MKQEQNNNLESIKKEEEEDLELVRFQFDGELQMEVSVRPDSYNSSACSDHLSNEPYSFHVLEYMSAFIVMVELNYEIIAKNGAKLIRKWCKIYQKVVLYLLLVPDFYWCNI